LNRSRNLEREMRHVSSQGNKGSARQIQPRPGRARHSGAA
jgi:hypothetical protein